MFIPPTLFPAAYANIVASSRGSSASRTFILVSPDVDAICAARLLVEMLRIDHVASTVIPVGSWGELEKVQERLASEEVRSLVLLNLGALVDLNSYFANLNLASATSSSSTQPEILIHVIDSHRPINLKNLFSSTDYSRGYFDLRRRRGRDQNEEERLEGIRRTGGRTEGEGIAVVIWSDEDGDEGREAEREAFEALEYEPDSDSESDSDEEVPLGRRRGQSSDEEDEDGSPGNGKRQRVDKNRGLSKILRRRYRAKLDRYYSSGTFSGQSVAGQIFLLAVLRSKADEDAVWLAILGLTHQFTTTQIDRTRYIAHSALLAEEVARLTSSSSSSAAESVSTGPNDRSIHASEELRFCLTRHWNLFDAIYHSGYVAGKLKLWKERGRKNLQGFLAKMGFSLQQCQQTYAHMDVDLKLSLFSSVETLAPEYGLFDLTFPSFIRKNGYRIDLSASDVIEAVGSLLEVATGIRLDFGGVSAVGGGGSGAAGVGMGLHGAGGGREEWKAEGMSRWIEGVEGAPDKSITSLAGNAADGGVAEEEGEEERRKEKQESDWATRNFWLAWDSLDNDTSLLRSALPLSMALHRAVIRQGTYMLDKQAIKTTRSYRLAVFDEGPDLAVFRHPASLVRLASWLVDAVREMVGQAAGGAAKKTLPFVLASLNEKNDAFLVVGIVGAVEYGDVRKNSFGLAFQEAASRSGARTRHNAFEASVVEVRKDDLQKFLLLLPLL